MYLSNEKLEEHKNIYSFLKILLCKTINIDLYLSKFYIKYKSNKIWGGSFSVNKYTVDEFKLFIDDVNKLKKNLQNKIKLESF